jgi:hypothetical protein
MQASSPVRAAIRDALVARPEYQQLDPDVRRALANGLVKISSAAQALAAEEHEARRAVAPQPLATAQNAGDNYSGVATSRIADTTRSILNAVSFPRFVTELINGVFKAMLDSNQQQMHSFVELIRNVAAATDAFADANVGGDGARQWLVQRFPASFQVDAGDPNDDPEDRSPARLRLRDGASMPPEGALRTGLGLAPTDSVPGDPESLVPIARAALARNRQSMLATMVMLGMQRIVIDSGRINASMRFHIDTRSAANEDRGSTFDEHNRIDASGHYDVGIWGVEAKMSNTIGYVSTDQVQTTEETNTSVDLNSSVELVFRTDYLPLERLAGQGDINRIRVNTLNPDEENRLATEAQRQRRDAAAASEQQRRDATAHRLSDAPAQLTPAPAPATRPASTSATTSAHGTTSTSGAHTGSGSSTPASGGTGSAPATGGGSTTTTGGGSTTTAAPTTTTTTAPATHVAA